MRNAAQRRVYGKRKANAPRPVFVDGSPYNVITGDVSELRSVDATLAEVEAKLEAIKIEQYIAGDEEDIRQSTTRKDDRRMVADELQDLLREARDNGSSPRDAKISEKPDLQANKTLASFGGTSGGDTNRTSRRRSRPKPRRSSGCINDEKTNSYVRRILDECVSPASRKVQKFSSWAARSKSAFDVMKIAEGSYGEVYKLRIREDACKRNFSRSKLAKLRAYGEGVFKIVPLRAQSGPGSRKFTSVEEIVAEVKLLKLLDPIPGFARFREIHVVQGRFSELFQTAWMEYKNAKDDCWNPNPANKRVYPSTQLWAILEMDDAGCELEKFSWSSTFQIYDIFWGVAMALARAEEYAMFEHRDLHLGNICLKSTRPDGCMDPPHSLDICKILKDSSGFGISLLETTIIDYSLSRATLRTNHCSNRIVEVASSDLDGKQIFGAIGQDDDEIFLRDTYRSMRSQIYTGSPLGQTQPSSSPGVWSEYTPKTNLIWLFFLLKNLLKHKKPERDACQLPRPPPKRDPLQPCPASKTNIQKHKPLSSKSGFPAMIPPSEDTKELTQLVAKLKQELSDRLNEVLHLLDFESGREDMCCAADLVAYAIDSNWLDEDDFLLS